MTDIHTGHLELENADDEQTNFANELKNLDKSPNQLKRSLLQNKHLNQHLNQLNARHLN